MNSKIKSALQVLGFHNRSFLPMMKEIWKQYLSFSCKLHPDKPGGSKEEFQVLLDAYNLVGDAIGENECDKNDQDEVIARNIFMQFRVTSVTENSDTFTIILDKKMADNFDKVLTQNLGSPTDMGCHGRKFTLKDECFSKPCSIYITKYKTNKVLIQSRNHILNIHFINEHLEELYVQAYRMHTPAVSGVFGPVKRAVKDSPSFRKLRSGRKAFQLPCKDCDFVATSITNLKEHRKHGHSHKPLKVLGTGSSISITHIKITQLTLLVTSFLKMKGIPPQVSWQRMIPSVIVTPLS